MEGGGGNTAIHIILLKTEFFSNLENFLNSQLKSFFFLIIKKN